MPYVTKKELIDKIQPVLTEIAQVREEMASALERLTDLLEKVELSVEEATDTD